MVVLAKAGCEGEGDKDSSGEGVAVPHTDTVTLGVELPESVLLSVVEPHALGDAAGLTEPEPVPLAATLGLAAPDALGDTLPESVLLSVAVPHAVAVAEELPDAECVTL